MLVSRSGIVILAASLTACAASRSNDGGRDGWSYDAYVTDVTLHTDASDGSAVDVAPTVDVVAFDAAASDSASDQYSPATDAAPNPCMLLAEQYVVAVREAQSCMTSSDCSAVVCETLCCNCQVYVNGHSTLLDRMAAIEAAWAAHGCADTSICAPSTACGGIVSTACTAAGRCATVHRGD